MIVMKKILLITTIVLAFIITSAQSTLHTTTSSSTINQPHIRRTVKQLANGYEIRKMLLPFTDSEAEYTVQKIGHDYIMDGDIVVGNDLPKTRSYAINGQDYKWPNGVIPVLIDASIYFNNMEKQVFDAIDEMNDKLGITVQLRTNEDDYVNIVGRGPDDLGYKVAGLSELGKQGGEQLVRLLVTANDLKGVLMHEMLHAAGIYHEMSRPDRDKFIKINWDNIPSNLKKQYDPHPGNYTTNKFDYCSIMLYSQISFIDANKTNWDPISDGKIILMPKCIYTIDRVDNYHTYSFEDIQGVANFYGKNFPTKIKIHRSSGEHFFLNSTILFSANQNFNFTYENDGTIKIRRVKDKFILWSSSTVGKPNGTVIMQADGNLVMYGPSGEVFWSSNTYNNWGSKLKLQNNGNLIINNEDGKQIWASNSFDNTTKKIQIQNGYSIKGTIKWLPEIGMPTTGNSSNWFTIKSFGPTAFEVNNVDKQEYRPDDPNHYLGRFIDYKNIGTITFEPIINDGELNVVNFKIKDLPLWIPYQFDISMNENIVWSGQISKPLPPFQIEPFIVSVGPIPQLKWGTYTTAIPYEDDITVNLTGSWSRKPTIVKPIDPKILHPKPGDPVSNPIIRTPVKSGTVQQSAIPVINKKVIVH